jgi:WD40 repeat protein
MESSAIEASISTHSLIFRSVDTPASFDVSVGNNSDRFANFHVEVSAPGENLSSGYKWYRISPEVAAAQPHGSTTTFQVIVFASPVPGFVGTIDLTVRVFSPQLRQERRLIVRLTIEADRRPAAVSIELPVREFQIYPRNTVDIPVKVRNLGQQFVEVVLGLTGIEPAWSIGGTQRRVSLPPTSQVEVIFQCQPPSVTQAPSQNYPFTIEAIGHNLAPGTNEGKIEVLPVGFISLALTPKHQQLPAQGQWWPNWKAKSTTITAAFKNDSNVDQQVDVLVQGKDCHRCRLSISPPIAHLQSGKTTTVGLEVTTERPWVGIGRKLELEAKPVLSDQRLGTTDPATESFTVRVLPIVPLWLQMGSIAIFAGVITLLLKPGSIAHTAFVNSVRLSGDGSTVLSGGDDCTIRRWWREGGKLKPAESLAAGESIACGRSQNPAGLLAIPDQPVSVLRLMPEDNNRLAVGLENGNVELWNVATAKKFGKLEPPQKQKTNDRVFDIVFSQDSKYLYAGHGSGSLNVWERSSPAGQFQLADPRHLIIKNQLKKDFQIRSLALNSSQNILVVGGNYKRFFTIEGKNQIVDSQNGQIAVQKLEELDKNLSAGSGDYIWGLAFAPNAPSILATADSDGYITIWDLTSCSKSQKVDGISELNCQKTGIKHRWRASQKSIRSIAFSEDGKLLVSGGDDGRLMAWWLTPEYKIDVSKGAVGKEIYQSDRKINSIDLKTIDRGVAIVSGSEDFQVKLHQLVNGE